LCVCVYLGREISLNTYAHIYIHTKTQTGWLINQSIDDWLVG